MLKTLATEEKLRELFVEVKKVTNNFTDFSPEIFKGNPNRLIIFRLSLGLSQQKFGNLLGVSHDWISLLEITENKIVKESTSKIIMKVVEREFKRKSLVNNVLLEDVINRFDTFSRILSKGFHSPQSASRINSLPITIRRPWMIKGGINSLIKRKLSLMELRVFRKLNSSGLEIKSRFLVKNKEVDFSIWKGNKLISLVEAIDSNFDPFKFLDIKKFINVPLICVLSNKRKSFIPSLSMIFDKVLLEKEINQLNKFLKNNEFIKKVSINIQRINKLSKLNESEKSVMNSLKEFDNSFVSQVRFEFSLNQELFRKTVDVVLPNIIENKTLPKLFVEIKNRRDPLKSVLDTSLESLILKRIFPSSKLILLILLKKPFEMWKLKRVLSLDVSRIGIDKICFSVEDLKKELESARRENFGQMPLEFGQNNSVSRPLPDNSPDGCQ